MAGVTGRQTVGAVGGSERRTSCRKAPGLLVVPSDSERPVAVSPPRFQLLAVDSRPRRRRPRELQHRDQRRRLLAGLEGGDQQVGVPGFPTGP